ncbi:zinc-dependent alcohol dehydrogenase family protein [Nonomuraea sp. NPDC002799]
MTKKVVFDELGGPEVLRVEEVELGEPGKGELRIRVDAIGLNRAEALFRAGFYFYQPSFPSAGLGYEAAGTVEAVGEGVDGFAPGDPVSSVPAFLMNEYGTYGQQAILPASAIVHRPDGIDAVTGASTWVAYTTAYGMLVEIGQIRPGDTVLITAASSSVGLAAIQIANHLGAIPIASTRTGGKRERLLQAGAAHVIATEEEDLAEQVHALTGGTGATLAVDAVAGSAVHKVSTAVAPGGILVLYGALDPVPIPLPVAADLRSRAIHWYSFFELTMDRPQQRRRAEHFINAGLRAGTLRPVIDRTFDLGDVVQAHRHLESNVQIGKIVLTVQH